jgi:centromere/kinetochore protein ZW10
MEGFGGLPILHVVIYLMLTIPLQIHVDSEKGTFTINKHLDGVTTNLDQSIVILQSYKELDKQAKKLWEDFYNFIMKPRMDFIHRDTLFAIDIDSVGAVTLTNKEADSNIRPLFRDIMALVDMLCGILPAPFLEEFASCMMLTLSPRIMEDWLDNAIPASLEEMVEYQKTLAQVHEFIENLSDLKWPGTSLSANVP